MLLPVCVCSRWAYCSVITRVALEAPASLLPHTVESHTTGLYLLLMLGYFALAFGCPWFPPRRQLSRLVIFVVALGVFESLVGLVQSLGGVHYIWSVPTADDWAHEL